MRRRTIIIWTVAGVLAATLGAIFPVALQIHTAREKARSAAALQRQMILLGEQGIGKQRNLAKWYNRNLTIPEPEQGFREAYGSILNFDGGVMGWMEIPALKLSEPVEHGTGKAAHDPDSAFPIGGRGNHTVIRLEEIPGKNTLQPGDTVQLNCLGAILYYRVAATPVGEDGQADILTLVFQDGSVCCVRNLPGDIQPEREAPGTGKRALLAAVLAVAAPLLLCIPGSMIRRERKRLRSGMNARKEEKNPGFREMNEKCHEKRRKNRKIQL